MTDQPDEEFDDGVDDERRAESPGRRADDVEHEYIARAVRLEVRKTKRRWFVVWVLTLALSVVAWRLAADANDVAQDTADNAARQATIARQSTRIQCLRSKRFLPYFTQVIVEGTDIREHPDDLKAFRTLIQPRC